MMIVSLLSILGPIGLITSVWQLYIYATIFFTACLWIVAKIIRLPALWSGMYRIVLVILGSSLVVNGMFRLLGGLATALPSMTLAFWLPLALILFAGYKKRALGR